MNGVVCHFTKTDKTSLASARIAKWLAERYDLEIHDRPDPEMVQDYDLAICVSSPSGFASPELREEIGEICAAAKRYVFAQNDYMTSQAGQIGKWMDMAGKDRKRRHVWSNMPHTCKNPWDTHINWNWLTWDPTSHDLDDQVVKGLSYYGACRKDREVYFQRFFAGDLPYSATISTTKRGAPKFQALGLSPEVVYEEPWKFQNELRRYQMLLYAEDKYTHRHYSHDRIQWSRNNGTGHN